VAVPVRDAARGEISLVGHVDRRNPLMECLLEFAGARDGRWSRRGAAAVGERSA
jgi:hypothetical protein